LDTPAVYGLTEYYRQELAEARLVACPGCYPTATLLALRPLVEAGLLDGDLIIDAKSGISGAGKKPTERTHFSECHGNVAAYGVLAHRHGAEIEQELRQAVTFTPHLVPLDRGLLATIYARVRPEVDEATLASTFAEAYGTEPFVRVRGDALPEIKHVTHTNFCDIGWKFDPASRRLVLVSCLDNLVKGAAGQALQNLNVAFGWPETTGLL
jgi:N-acetyl-gamma-glutamyl-phosphate reductase